MVSATGKRSAAPSPPSQWRAPALLIGLSVIPILAGALGRIVYVRLYPKGKAE